MLRYIIIFGALLFFVGIYAEYALTSWGGTVLIASTIITYISVLLWLLSSENRAKLKASVPVFTSTTVGDITISNDTRARRDRTRAAARPYVSVMSICVIMAIVHIMTFFLHKSALYQAAVESVKANEEIITKVGEIKDYSYATLGVIQDNGRSNLIFGVKGTNGTYWVQAIFNSVENVPTLEQITPIGSADALFGK